MTQTFRTGPCPFIMVTGGCRSGKSGYAQQATEACGAQRLYIATCEALDREMEERVRLHQEARGSGWRVLEPEPGQALRLWERLPALVRPGEAVLFDCLSLWAAGCMQGEDAPSDFAGDCDRLLSALRALPCPVFLVNSEVGLGVVPGTKAGRTFRDMAGLAGQKAAALADSVVLMVSGIPMAVKGVLPKT